MNPTRLLVLFAFAVCSLASSATSHAESSQIQATVVLASSDNSGMDPQLQKYASNLKKLFKHNSFKRYGGSNGQIELPGSTNLNLGKGYQLNLVATPVDGGRIRLNAKWIQGSRTLIETTLVVTRNRPSVLGGPRVENGELILLLVAR